MSQAIQQQLQHVLQINHLISRLPVIAEDIKLIACNAEISASRAGESGRSLRVMTSDINQLANIIHERVSDVIRHITNATRHIGVCATNLRNYKALNDASDHLSSFDTSLSRHNLEKIQHCTDVVMKENLQLFDATEDALYKLSQGLLDIREQIRFGEMLSVNIGIEVPTALSGNEKLEVFLILSDHLRQACEEMTGIISQCDKLAVTLRQQAAKREAA